MMEQKYMSVIRRTGLGRIFMNFLINVVGIKFKPKNDDNVGIPVSMLERIQNKTVAENWETKNLIVFLKKII